MIKAEFETSIKNEPLVETAPSLEGLSDNFLEAQGSAIYYGTGLTTPKALSVGLPFDVLGMVLTAERLRRHLNLDHIYHHVADTHALSNDFADAAKVDVLTDMVTQTMARVTEHLGLKNLTVVPSSTFDKSAKYESVLDSIVTEKGEYVRRELADMLWYRRERNVVLKMGWIIQAGPVKEGFDERLYDNEFRNAFDDELSFVYLKAGRTFDQRRPKASPYISIPDEQRILLVPNERVEDKIEAAKSKWPDKTLGGSLNHLNAILRLYDQIAETPLERGPLPQRIQCLIDRIFTSPNAA